MKSRLTTLVLTIVTAIAQAQTCTYLAYEAFDQADGTVLNGLSGSTGWASPWQVQNADATVPGYQVVQSGAMGFSGLQTLGNHLVGGSVYLTSGRRIDTSPTGPFAVQVGAGGDAIGQAAGSTVLYMSALLRKDIDNGEDVWMAVHSDNVPWCTNCAQQRMAVGYFGSASDVAGQRRWSLDLGGTVYTTSVPVTVGQTALLVVRLTFNTLSTQVDLFVDPSGIGQSDAPAATLSQTTSSALQIRSLAVYLGSASGNGSIDEIRFADSWPCATPDANVTVDAPPVALLTATPTSGQAPFSVSFDASASSDPENQALSYFWDFGDGNTASGGSTANHTYTGVSGQIPASVTVTDPGGQSVTQTVIITVLDANGTFSCQPSITCVSMASCSGGGGHLIVNVQGADVTLSGSLGPIAPQSMNEYTGLDAGIYTLQVNGTNGCSDTRTLHVQIDSTACPGWSPDPCQMTVGMNLSTLSDWSPERPFRNLFKHVRETPIAYLDGCFCFSTPGLLELMTFDSDGYPTHIPQVTTLGNGLVKYIISSDGGNLIPNGQYLLLFDGTGQIQFGGGVAAVGAVTAGRMEFTAGNGNIWIEITQSAANDHVRNIRLVRPSDEFVDLDADPFYPVFLDKIEPYSTLRFMDWGRTNYSPVAQWSQRTPLSFFTYARAQGMPYELMIDLANRLDKDVYICVPHLADDAYVIEMATLFRDNLEPERTIYLEWSNEVWNWIFDQAHYNNDNRPLNLNYGRAMAQRAGHLFEVWGSVFGGQMNRVRRVLGLQGGFNTLNQDILSQLPTDAWDMASPSHYFGLDHGPTGQPVLGATSTAADVMDNAWNAFIQFKESVKLDYRNVHIYGKEVLTYEGGQHFVGNVFGIPYDYQQSMWDAQYSPEMYTMYRAMHDSIASWGCRVAINFSNAAVQESVYGSWGVLSHIDQQPPYTTTAPKYQALLDIIDQCQPLPVGLGQQPLGAFSLWPNPNTGTFSYGLPHSGTATMLTITDLSGREILAQRNPAVTVSAELSSGTYIVRISASDGSTYLSKMVVE